MAGHGKSTENSSGHVPVALAFLLIGIGVGSLTAALLTPKTGKQVRKALRRRYDDAREAVGRSYEDAREAVGRRYDDAREAVGDLGDQASGWIERGGEWADAVGSKVAPIANKLKRDIR